MTGLNRVTDHSENSGSAELLQEVAGRLVSVEEGLAALDNHKTALHNHANMVKAEISSAIEHHMSSLRAKEKQLIRQVEVASTHQNSEVNVTQAQLLQHKGALSVTRTILDNCSTAAANINSDERCGGAGTATVRGCHGYNNNNNSTATYQRAAGAECSEFGSTVRNTIATTVNCMPHQDVAGLLEHTEKLLRVPLVSVSVDETTLSGAIQRFGRVSSPPILSHSELLPQCLEEYGDDEHHVLHKSVQPDLAFAAAIDVRRPYLLAAKKMQGINKAAAAAATKSEHCNQLPACAIPVPTVTKPVECGAKEDLVKWLNRMHLDTSTDDAQAADCCGGIKSCGDVCIEDACQANEVCSTFSNCLLAGQCKKSALEKAQQSAKWQLQDWYKQQQQAAGEDNSSNTTGLQFDMDLSSFCSRKRAHSDTNQAVTAVLAHMSDILNSSNGSWLIRSNKHKENKEQQQGNVVVVGGDDIHNTNAVSQWIERNTTTSSPIMMKNNCKKMKVEHSDTAANNHSNNVRSAVLYLPPQSEWILPQSGEHQYMDTKVAPTIELTPDTEFNLAEKSSWLLPVKEINPNQVSTKKANCDKENNLWRASLMKSQLSLNNFGSTENLKDKIDWMSSDSHKSCNIMSDIDMKESWLLQQCNSVRADNKVMEEVMSRKAEWLSDSSLASFSIITDPEAPNTCWLLGQQF